MMVPSIADTRAVIIRDPIIAQKRHGRMVGLSCVAMTAEDASLSTEALFPVNVFERPDVAP